MIVAIVIFILELIYFIGTWIWIKENNTILQEIKQKLVKMEQEHQKEDNNDKIN